MFLTSEELASTGLGAVFGLFLVALVFLRVATRAQTSAGRRVGFFGAWLILSLTAPFRVLSGSLGHKDSYLYQLQFLSEQGARGVPMARTGTGGANEPLYLLLIRTLRMFTDNPHVFFVIAFGTIAFGFVYFISRTLHADSPILPLLLIFPSWLHAFSAVRNWMAIALVLVALTWYMRKRSAMFYLVVAIATGFHFSAALFFAFPFGAWLLFRRRGLAWSVFVLAVVNALAYGSSEVMARVFAGTRYEYYLSTEAANVTFILPMLTIALVGLYLVQRSDQFVEEEKRLLTFPILVCGIITIILFYGGYRYVGYTVIPQAIIASWSLRAVPTRFPDDALVRAFWRVVIYGTVWIWAVATLRSVIHLSGVFPVIWSR